MNAEVNRPLRHYHNVCTRRCIVTLCYDAPHRAPRPSKKYITKFQIITAVPLLRFQSTHHQQRSVEGSAVSVTLTGLHTPPKHPAAHKPSLYGDLLRLGTFVLLVKYNDPSTSMSLPPTLVSPTHHRLQRHRHRTYLSFPLQHSGVLPDVS